MKNSKAIVTLVIGKKYVDSWNKLCRDNWQKYADKYGYDIIYIDRPLDSTARAQQRSPAWQKCLILSQEFSQKYQRIVWIDSDILINSSIAPCIVKDVPIDKIGAVDECLSPTSDLYFQTLERKYDYCKYSNIRVVINHTAKHYYSNYGLPPKFNSIVQTGVLVLSPNHHRKILEKVYLEYEDKGSSQWNYEMRPLSWELINGDYIHWIDHRFNVIWFDYLCLHYPFLLEKARSPFIKKIKRKIQNILSIIGIYPHPRLKSTCATTAFTNSFFLHFAGCASDMVLVDTKSTSWRNLIARCA